MVANFQGTDNENYQVFTFNDRQTQKKKLKNDFNVLRNVREMEIDLDYLKSYILETYENMLAKNK